MFKSETTSFHYFSPRILDIRHREVGEKRRLNGISKVNTHTDKHTNKHTYGHFDLQKASAQRADALKSTKYPGKIIVLYFPFSSSLLFLSLPLLSLSWLSLFQQSLALAVYWRFLVIRKIFTDLISYHFQSIGPLGQCFL